MLQGISKGIRCPPNKYTKKLISSRAFLCRFWWFYYYDGSIFCHKLKYCQNLGHHLMLESTRALVKVQCDQLWWIKILCTMAPEFTTRVLSLSNFASHSCEATMWVFIVALCKKDPTRGLCLKNQPKLTQRKISLVIYIQNDMKSSGWWWSHNIHLLYDMILGAQ